MKQKIIGLLVGDENDWPNSFTQLLNQLRPTFRYRGDTIQVNTERLRIHPFALNAPTRYNLIIDRLAYWHLHPREWLKKAALVNRVYLLNNPFTFQCMEKHAAYCAMLRLGLRIPETWLIPQREPPLEKRLKFEETARRYHDLFDLPTIAREMGYPLYLKPFDGGGWRGVSRVNNEWELMEAYNSSGQMMMHLQKGLDNFQVFVRSLGIGPQIMTMKYDPSKPQHERYQIDHAFLSAEHGREQVAMTKIINAFFCWDFNSCETIIKDNIGYPIDFANACPDIAITSLHHYYPWAIKALVAWSLFCVVTNRPMQMTMNMQSYFEIADSERSYEEKLLAYEALADAHLQKEAFNAFLAEHLPHLDGVMWEMVQSAEFDHTLVNTIRSLFPLHEQEHFIAHYRHIFQEWVRTNPAS